MNVGSHGRDIPVLVGAAVTESELAYDHLAGREPVMRDLVCRLGRPEPFGRSEEAGLGDDFSALVRYSAARPLHAPSTSVVYAEICRATSGHPSAAKVADLGAGGLAALGMPAADADRLVRLARAQLAGDVELDLLVGRNDRQVRQILAWYGISRYVTDLFLIRRLHRPDVLPADDPTLAHIVRQIWACGSADKGFGWRWAPFRTYAAALLWALSRETTAQVG
jgi:3-methyladenine DNA glycosylase/8-oxoguanine DNA glycosylase